MTYRLPSSVRLNLLLVVLAGILPVLAVVLSTGWERRQHEIEHGRMTALRLAEYYANMQEGEARRIEGALGNLAATQEVRSMDVEACDALFKTFLEANPGYVNFALLAPNGEALASALPFTRQNLSNRKEVIEALTTGQFAVGEYSIGRVSGAPVLPFALPVKNGRGDIIGVLIATLRLGDLATIFDQARLPEASFVGLVDHKGQRLYRYPKNEHFTVGEKIAPAAFTAIQAIDRLGAFTELGSDGARRLYASVRLRLAPGQQPYLNIFVGIPENVILADADAVTVTYVKWLGLSLLLSTTLAMLIGKFGIHDRVARLVNVAQRLGSGDLTARSGLSETSGSLGKLAVALDDMARALERDITERERTSRALEAEARRRAALMDHSADGIVVIDQEHRIVEANRSFAAMLGYGLDEIIGLATWDYEAVMSEADIRQGFHHVGAIQAKFESLHRRKDGSLVQVEVSASGAEIDGAQLVLCVVRDIGERKRAEARIRESEARYRALAEEAPVSIMAFDARGRIAFVNKRHLESFAGGRKNPEFFLGRRLTELPGVVRAGIPHLLEPLLDGRPVDLEAVHFPEFTGGHSGYVNLRGVPLFRDDGTPDGGILIREDVTARVEMERKLRESRNAAEAASKAKSEFLANMSHEIRTPLNGVMGMLQLLKTSPLAVEQAEWAELAIQSSRRLTRLLSDILDISRIEAGKMLIQAEPFDLAETIREVVELFMPTSRQTGVLIRQHVDPSLPRRVVGDASRVQQVLTNLVGNAFKFTTSGQVSIEAYPLPAADPGRQRVLFSVSDTGCGIPDAVIGTLFEPFTQASQGYKRTYQGAGLGLSICKRLVGLMGGNIAVESEVGVGVTVYFCVNFGLADPERPAPEASMAGPDVSVRGLRVLLVEDEQVSSLATAMQLGKAGHEVVTADDGQKAVDLFASRDFDLVLMDIQLPVLDGVEATRIMRDTERFGAKAGTPVVAMTAYAMAGDRETFLAAGIDDYVSKPVDTAELARVIVRVMAAKRSGAAT